MKKLYTILFFLILLSSQIYAQCNFNASITTSNAGICNNSNGFVLFEARETTANTITQFYYVVRNRSDNSLVTSSNNINPEVSLPAGSYTAEVIAHCTAGGQGTLWSRNFTIGTTTDSEFSVTFGGSRATLISKPTGRITYSFSKKGKYSIKMIKHPAGYTGPKLFELSAVDFPNTGSNNDYYIEDLVEGTGYEFEISNGCKTIKDGPRSVYKVLQDIPSQNTGYLIDLYSYNTMGGGIYTSAPTENLHTFYLAAYSSNLSALPIEYWRTIESEKHYEYAVVFPQVGETIAGATWKPLVYNPSNSLVNRVDAPLSVRQIADNASDRPSVYVRLKHDPSQMVTGISSMSVSYPRLRILPTDNCDRFDVVTNYFGNGHTYPLDIVLRTDPNGSNPNVELRRHTVTEEDMKTGSEYTFNNVDLKDGCYMRLEFKDPGGFPNAVGFRDLTNYKIPSVNSITDLIGTPTLNWESISTSCYTYRLMTYINYGPGSSTFDYRGVKVKYTGTEPLQEGAATEFEIPADYSYAVNSLYLTTVLDQNGKWRNSSVYGLLPGKTYTWEISVPCGNTGVYETTTRTITTPIGPSSQVEVIAPEKFDPKVVASDPSKGCGFLEIEIGEFENLRNIFQIRRADGSAYASDTYFRLYKKSSPTSTYYSALSNNDGVYYDGNSAISFRVPSSGSVNAEFVRPKIRVNRPGKYYLIATAYENVSVYDNIFDAGCALVREFEISEADFNATINIKRTAAYFCSQDKTSGIIYVAREGADLGNKFTYRIWNDSGTFDKSFSTSKTEVVLRDVNPNLYGNKFNASIISENGCTISEARATLTMNTVSNSAAFITQSQSSSCDGTVDVDIRAEAYTFTKYEWMDAKRNTLSNTNVVQGKFATGTKLILKVTFSSENSLGEITDCDTWEKEYFVEGIPLDAFYWRKDASNSNWNSKNNWNNKDGQTASGIPNACSVVYIPSVVTSYYPDLAGNTTAVTNKIYFEFGAQLYNQQNLNYKEAYVSYDYGYYDMTSLTEAPTSLVQPTKSKNQVTASTTNKSSLAFSTLPVMKRARWYMLSTPLKGASLGDFQLDAKPFTMQRVYKQVIEKDPTRLTEESSLVIPDNNISLYPNSNFHALALWIPPYSYEIGAKDQSVLQSLDGNIQFPYFLDESILNIRKDRTFDRTTLKMDISTFSMETLNTIGSNTITVDKNFGRFSNEDESGQAQDNYTIQIVTDAKRTKGEELIGNPFMAPIDFDAFYAANSALIEDNYKILVDNKWETYSISNPSGNTLTKYIAPLQAIIVTLKNKTGSCSLNFPFSVMAPQSTTTSKVKVK